MSLMIKELKGLILKSELVSLSRDCWDQELTGHLCKVNDNFIAMHLFTDEGYYDGFTVFETDQVTEVYWGNREHQAIAKLIAKNEHIKTPTFNSLVFSQVVIELESKFSSMSFYYGETEEQFEVGRIEAYDEEWLKVKTFGVKRTLSPKYILFQRDEITRVEVNSPYQNNLVELHDS